VASVKIGVLALQGAFREHLSTLVAIGACFWPARKASAVQPLEALRYE